MYVGLRLVEHKVGIIKGVAQEEFNFLFVSRVYVLFFNNSELYSFADLLKYSNHRLDLKNNYLKKILLT